MRYKVPQNIDMQDRIIGPLTMIQFVYAVIGGGFCYTIFMKVPLPFSLFLVIPLALFTFAMVFVKINERPFWNFVTSVFTFMSAPKQRIWQHDGTDLNVEIYTAVKNSGPVYQPKEYSREDLQSAADKLDQTPFHK